MNRIRVRVAVSTVALAACAGHHGDAPPPTHARRADGTVVLTGASAQYVKTEPAASASGGHTRRLVGRVSFDERHLATIGPPVQGRVAAVNVVTGDHVERGAVLLSIHSQDLAAAQAQAAETRTTRALAEATFARTQELVRQGAASEAELAQNRAAVAQARDEEHRATASLAAIGGAPGASDYQLRSPISGTVVERNVAVGNEVHVDQDHALVRIADLSTVWVTADVYEQDLATIHVNDPVTVEVTGLPGRRFAGRLAYVGEIVDPATRAALTRVELANPDLTLRPGMFAHVEVQAQLAGGAEIPTSAILARRDQFFVFVANADGSYGQREIHVGEQEGQHTTVLDGIRPGDRVVTEGAILLDAEANEAL